MNDMMAAPVAPYRHDRQMSQTPSIASMETADMASRTPMRSQSGYGLSAAGGMDAPYRYVQALLLGIIFIGERVYAKLNNRDSSDINRADTRTADFLPGTGDERYGQPTWTVRPQEQRYLPVNVR